MPPKGSGKTYAQKASLPLLHQHHCQVWQTGEARSEAVQLYCTVAVASGPHNLPEWVRNEGGGLGHCRSNKAGHTSDAAAKVMLIGTQTLHPLLCGTLRGLDVT